MRDKFTQISRNLTSKVAITKKKIVHVMGGCIPLQMGIYSQWKKKSATLFILLVETRCFVTVRRKFNIDENTTLKFVLEADGCVIDKVDLGNIMPLSDPLMVLCDVEVWSVRQAADEQPRMVTTPTSATVTTPTLAAITESASASSPTTPMLPPMTISDSSGTQTKRVSKCSWMSALVQKSYEWSLLVNLPRNFNAL